ncbi:hypothetical protein LEP1GSC016_1257 [Leptospira borgpetersenii serovar Hardjo-bovis str. Sponselee]|uniref:Uncharacterized protein n=2 Tax=Leptospira borgpetersenii TaxID=174 RepID=M6BL65_LEPBO|nr:hypothetical protein LEP1GSC016_1257 [Leptospira borgpetersenii serovar Hardjo-bovis str. Sponselee]EMO63815.1 hypothetical protein LEP1GSC133_2010 [Leptospira borgpetersenii serovar Pomona str. 200901868]
MTGRPALIPKTYGFLQCQEDPRHLPFPSRNKLERLELDLN